MPPKVYGLLSEALRTVLRRCLRLRHQGAALTGEVGVDFTLEVGFKQITGTNTDTQCYGLVFRFSGCVLIHGIA
jgi:hypothetical protein